MQTPKKVKFKLFQGVTIGESLPFGVMRVVGAENLNDGPSRILQGHRQFIMDLVTWEEALGWVHIVPAMPLIIDPDWRMGRAGRRCLVPFKNKVCGLTLLASRIQT